MSDMTMRSAGRPSLGVTSGNSRMVRAFISAEDADALEAIAAQAGTSLATTVRAAVAAFVAQAHATPATPVVVTPPTKRRTPA